MFKLTVKQILSSIEMLSDEEKRLLFSNLRKVITDSSQISESQARQSMDNKLSNITVRGNGAAFSFQPIQSGQNTNMSSIHSTFDKREIFQALSDLREAVRSSNSLPELSKLGAESQIDQLATETKKQNPDKNTISRIVSALKQGLIGVKELAEPVTTVASIIAKAWGLSL